jgi:hypothetical protein
MDSTKQTASHAPGADGRYAPPELADFADGDRMREGSIPSVSRASCPVGVDFEAQQGKCHETR